MSYFVRGIELPPNKFRKAKIKVGDKKLLYDPYAKKYDLVEVKLISDKGNYNVYHCIKDGTGFRTSFTDKDFIYEGTVKDFKEGVQN